MNLLAVSFELPITDPVLIFALVLFIILFIPLFFQRIRIPAIVGIILAGVLVGPNGLNILQRSSSIILFGTVGLLYIMFVAGLEMDLNDFRKNRNRSLAFGALTFFVPLLIGSITSYYILGFGWLSAILMASMYSTQTLVAYPIVSRLGISKKEAVTVTIGGTIITDTAVLLVLAVVTGAVNGDIGSAFWIQLGVSVALFTGAILWGMPLIARWFFKNIESEGVSQYIFVLAMVFTAAFLAELAGVEAIIGAFLAGLALNRLIPHTSALMNRIEFVGNAIFIPFFLINVGMLVDLRVLFRGTEALMVAGLVIILAFATKWLAAFFTQKLFNYSVTERNLIFGLSSAHAAAMLAVILVGFDLGLLNENVLNAAILLILVSCMVSSFVVERTGRQLALQESEKAPDLSNIADRILVPISNPATIEQLIDFAILIKDPRSPEPIFPLAVVKDTADTNKQLVATYKMLEKAIHHASATENSVQLVSRIDMNIAGGIIRAIRELLITEVVIGWNGKITTRERIFGSVLDNLLQQSQQMILVCKIIHPLNTMKRIIVAVPPNAEREPGFLRWVSNLRTISRQIGADLKFFGNAETNEQLQETFQNSKPSVNASFHPFDDWEDFLVLAKEVSPNDLLMVISARNETISHNSYLDRVPRHLAKHFDEISFVIIYPEQNSLYDSNAFEQALGQPESSEQE